MEKNVIVTDVNGKVIGATYPKRAKGLVKNGRAEFIDDQNSIRLKFTHAPAVDKITEEINMSKVIDFNAREFNFDDTCRSLDGAEVNTGMRAFVSLSFGNAEVWEIGDWCWTWSQIECRKTLEKNTDYVFRFSMEGGVCDTDDAVTVAHICPKGKWEERYSFLLDHNKFLPAVCKLDGDALLRIFELPFNTGEYEEWRIILQAQHAVTRYFAPVNSAVLEGLPDISYKDWWAECQRRKQAERAGMKASFDSGNSTSYGLNIGIDSQEFNESEFALQLSRIGDGCNVGFENVTVHSGASSSELNFGVQIDSSNLAFENCTFTSLAMSTIIAKIGDGCNLAFDNITITEEGIDKMLGIGKKADGVSIALENVTLPRKVLDLLYAKMGEGCNIAHESITAYDQVSNAES